MKAIYVPLLVGFLATSLPRLTARGQEGASPSAQSVVLVDRPQSGSLRRIEGDLGAAYVTFSDEVDRFSFAASSDEGVSLFDVTFDPLLGVALIETTDVGGPVVCGAELVPLELVVVEADSPTSDNGAENRSTFGGGSKKKTQPVSPSFHRVGPRDGYILVIYVDLPGDGRGHGMVENGSAGHAFVQLIDGEHCRALTVGLGPRTGFPPRTLRPVPGRIQEDFGHDWEVKYKIQITQEQYEMLLARIRGDIRNPPNYDLNDNNCVDYAIGIAALIGVRLTPKPSPVTGGNTPENFGEYLLGIGAQENLVHR